MTETIPDDVVKAAEECAAKIADQLLDYSDSLTVNKYGAEEIARAIAEERERCSQIADEWKSPLRHLISVARILGNDEAARDIAAAIRGQK